MPNNISTPCEYARERHKNYSIWKNLWTGLLFAFGTTIIIFFCAAILLFIRATWLPGAVSTIGLISSGIGIKWVVNRRKEAVAEEEKAYHEVAKQCGETKEADKVRLKHKILKKF